MRLVKKNSTGNCQEFIDDNGDEILKSYDVFVAKKSRKQLYVRTVMLDEEYWDYSSTTSKHIGLFLGDSMTNIRKLVKDGIIELVNLN